MSSIRTIGTVKQLTVENATRSSFANIHRSEILRCVTTGSTILDVGNQQKSLPLVNFPFFISTGSGGISNIVIGKPKSQRVVNITKGSTTLIDFPEGTGCPFGVGDSVCVLSGQSAFDAPQTSSTTGLIVLSINKTAGVNGYYSTRMELDWDTSAIVDTFDPNYWTEVRSVFFVNVREGVPSPFSNFIYYQQVQNS